MSYTIVTSDKKTRFIQQDYATVEEAQKRLDALGEKFGQRLINKEGEKYSLVIVGVDEDGGFHELTESKESEKTT